MTPEYEAITLYHCLPYIPSIKEGKVLKVYDGDTITIASKIEDKFYKFSVRIRGVDCPEIRGDNETEKQAAIIVRDKLSELINNKMVILEDIDYDKYGRILATVKFNNINIDHWLLINHYAVPYNKKKKIKIDDWLDYMKN
jgi:micrococcal nuclease